MLLALRYGVAVFRSKSRKEQRKMDNPLLLKERLNTYSQTMARQQGRMLLELSERVNRDFLKDRTVGNAFRHEMHCFLNDKLQNANK